MWIDETTTTTRKSYTIALGCGELELMLFHLAFSCLGVRLDWDSLLIWLQSRDETYMAAARLDSIFRFEWAYIFASHIGHLRGCAYLHQGECEANLSCNITNSNGLEKFIRAWDFSCLPRSYKVISFLILLCSKCLVWWKGVGVRLRPPYLFSVNRATLYFLTGPNQTLIMQSQQCLLSLLCPIFKHPDSPKKKKRKKTEAKPCPPPCPLSLIFFLGILSEILRAGFQGTSGKGSR